MRGRNLWCEETKTTVKIIGHSRPTKKLLRRNVSDFQLSDKALDLVKDPNGGNVTFPPQEGRLSRGRGPGGPLGDVRSSPAEESLVYCFRTFRLSSAGLSA